MIAHRSRAGLGPPTSGGRLADGSRVECYFPAAPPSGARRSRPPSRKPSLSTTITSATPWPPPLGHGVAHRLQLGDGVGREAVALHAEAVGQPLVVHPAGVHGFLRVHAEVDDVEDGHQHGVDDGAAAGRAGDHEELAVLGQDRRRHARQHPLAGHGQVGLGADVAVVVGHLGRRVEVAHLVVEQEAGARHDDARAVAVLERVGHRHGVALRVDDRQVRRLLRLGRPR